MYDIRTDGAMFAKTYLNKAVATFFDMLPVAFPPKVFAKYILITVLWSMLLALIFRLIFGKRW